MHELVPDRIFIERIPLRFYGIGMGTRMTVVRLQDNSLFIHSPTTLDEETRARLDAMGPIRFIVAPTKLHHLFVGPYFEAYPDARIFCSPDLEHKRRDLPWHGVLGDEPEPGWAGELDQAIFHGSAFMDEVVFCHRPTGTLIVTDLVENFHDLDGWRERLLARLGGVYRRPGLTRDQRLILLNRRAARASAEKILTWDFERIVLAHGKLIEADGKAVFQDTFKWLLGPS